MKELSTDHLVQSRRGFPCRHIQRSIMQHTLQQDNPYSALTGSSQCHPTPTLLLYLNLPCCPGARSEPTLAPRLMQVEMKINSSEGSFNFLYLSENKCELPSAGPGRCEISSRYSKEPSAAGVFKHLELLYIFPGRLNKRCS